MTLEDRIVHWLEDGETRGKALKWGWRISVAFLIFGYGVILWELFLA